MEAELEVYRLEGVQETLVEVGMGSYGSVIEVYYKGLKCAAKKMYPVLYEGGVGDRLDRFRRECRTMSSLRHPNIVQFLGIYFERGPRGSNVPVLVMEYLPLTLCQCIEQQKGALPDELSYPILRDVLLGLRYLHEQTPIPLVHQDLSTNNVLLTVDMVAKISDMGMAKLLRDHQQPRTRLTVNPGTAAFMPPEATVTNPVYNASIDMFSFGAVALHISCGIWPDPIDAMQPYAGNPNFHYRISEVNRRKIYIDMLREDHPLLNLIKDCLNDDHSKRPSAAKALDTIYRIMQNFPPPSSKLDMLHEKIELQRRYDGIHQELVQTTQSHRQLFVSKCNLEEQVAGLQFDKAMKESELAHIRATLEKISREFTAQTHELNRVVEEKRDALSQWELYQQLYVTRCGEIARIKGQQEAEIRGKDAELRIRENALAERESVVRNLSLQLQRAREHILQGHTVSSLCRNSQYNSYLVYCAHI